jgi:cytochrome c
LRPPCGHCLRRTTQESKFSKSAARDATHWITKRAGPRLRGVYGRSAASLVSFPYSEALRKSGTTWDGDSLNKWLTDPDTFVPDNDMAFRVANPEERAAIIGYLREVSGK